MKFTITRGGVTKQTTGLRLFVKLGGITCFILSFFTQDPGLALARLAVGLAVISTFKAFEPVSDPETI